MASVQRNVTLQLKDRIVGPEKTIFAREKPINTFPLQPTRDATVEEM